MIDILRYLFKIDFQETLESITYLIEFHNMVFKADILFKYFNFNFGLRAPESRLPLLSISILTLITC